MIIHALFFEDFETLDVFGPIEILSKLKNAELRCLSLAGGLIKSRQGYSVKTEKAEEFPSCDVLLIPGGQGTRNLVNDCEFINELKNLCQSAEYILTVCTGAAVLAKTGLLNGKRATSNKNAFDWVMSISDEVTWDRPARWISDGKVYTSSGVAAGMDMTLGFISDCFGREEALRIQKMIEYNDRGNDETRE